MLNKYFFEHKVNQLINQMSIPSFEENSGQTFWFENDVCDATSDWPVSEVLMASMSSPSFFAPLTISADPSMPSLPAFEFIDGSTTQNNPAKHMVANAIGKGVDLSNIFVVSIGTGKTKMQGKHADKKLFWENELEGHSITRQSQYVHDELADLLPEGNYVRI